MHQPTEAEVVERQAAARTLADLATYGPGAGTPTWVRAAHSCGMSNPRRRIAATLPARGRLQASLQRVGLA